ncbi:MAG: iron chaperone [Bacteroidota bacterium]
MERIKVKNIDDYIAHFPEKTQKLLQQVRTTIKKAAPKAEEAISYAIPTFRLYGKNLVHFAGYNHHIGFYPGAAVVANFKKEISGYKNAKGSIQFPLDKPMPLSLITKITEFRIKQNEEKAKKAITKNKKISK